MDIIPPPETYAPLDYISPPAIHFRAPDDLLRTCRHLIGSSDGYYYGCTQIWADRCDIFIDISLDPPIIAATLEHELAHCKGWPGDHPPW